MAEIVFVRLLFPLTIGICYCYRFATVKSLDFATIIVFFIFSLLIAINIYYKTLYAYRFKYLIGILFFFLFFALGGLLVLLQKDTLKSHYFGNYEYEKLKIWIHDEPQVENGILRFTANVTRAFDNQASYPVTGKLLLAIELDSTNKIAFNYGDELIVSAISYPVNPPYNPAEFNFRNWLASRNIYLQTFIKQHKAIKTGANKGKPIMKFAFNLRKQQIAIYKKLIKNKEAFAVASTLILGYRADLSMETLSAYSKTGTIHALSVSGMHVGIIYIVLNWLLSFMDKNQKLRIIKILLICGLIWFYSLLTGFSPSVLRSVIMLTVYIVAKSFNKHTNGYNILAFTAFCLLIYNPFLVWDVGFQLSFLAVFGLIYLHPKIYHWFYFKLRWADWIWSSVALSLAAQVTTFPLSIYYFHQFPIYFIFSNLFILIPVTLLMYLGISILLFKFYFLAPIFEWIIIFMNNGLNWIGDLPFSGINQIWIDETELTLLTLALIMVLIGLAQYRKRLLLVSALFVFIFQTSLAVQSIIHKQQKKIVFFTLQKGYCVAFIKADSALIISSLIPSEKNFQFYIRPALDQFRVTNIQSINWESKPNFSFFKMDNYQITFYNFRILVFSPSLNRKMITNHPSFNAVWLHQNPKQKVNEIRRSVVFKSIIIDATNYRKNLENYVDDAKKFQIQFHILKKNKAYLIDLNKQP